MRVNGLQALKSVFSLNTLVTWSKTCLPKYLTFRDDWDHINQDVQKNNRERDYGNIRQDKKLGFLLHPVSD